MAKIKLKRIGRLARGGMANPGGPVSYWEKTNPDGWKKSTIWKKNSSGMGMMGITNPMRPLTKMTKGKVRKR